MKQEQSYKSFVKVFNIPLPWAFSVKVASKGDATWWVQDDFAKYSHIVDLSTVEGKSFKAVQIVIGRLKLAAIWNKP